jgi:hypothetical protein
MALNSRLLGVLDWLREGYPAGVPPKDYIPLLALLRRRLTEDEVREIAHEIAALGSGADGVNGVNGLRSPAEIGVQITKLTDAMPSPEDIALIEERLVSHHGWPVDD